MKLVVLSDLHLILDEADPQNLDNLGRLNAGIDRINGAYPDADLVIFAGDIADRGRHIEPYRAFKSALSRLMLPCAVTIGNHDARENFVSVFGDGHCDENGFVQSVHDIEGMRVIVMDSVSDEPAPEGFRGARSPKGQLCAARLDWLDRRLDEAAGRPVIVVLHHPPLQLQISSDTMALENPKALIDVLVAHGDVRQVLSGHIHMTSTAIHRGIPFTTIAGNYSTTSEDFGHVKNKIRREGPAQMAVVLSDPTQTTVHFDNYVDTHPVVIKG